MEATVAVPFGPEFNASFDEACRAMPLLRELRAELGLAIQANDEESKKRIAFETSLLMHVYRLAEDMGYEW